ncbi:MAG: response regulator [Alphaproteobacteria bacterium]|nr:response regulator [Alphaproteobacteria bacterium]
MRVLLIEDDQLIGDGLKIGLTKLGFSVDWFTNGEDGQEALFQSPYDAVVLDLTLPEIDGLQILDNWRKSGRKDPVLILTARGDVEERILGLNKGADDYLPKPFDLGEVVARLNALIRRQSGATNNILWHQDISFNLENKFVQKNGKEIILAPKEVAVLELLLLNKNRVLSKTQIEEKLYSWDDDVSSNAVEVHIHHLRKKLGKNIIKTINKIGYMLGEEQ